MKLKYSLITAAIVTSVTMVGCSSGGGGSNNGSGGGNTPPPVSTAPSAVTSVAGLVGGTTNNNVAGAPARRVTAAEMAEEGTATLIVDSNANGKFTDKDDAVYTAPIQNGSFAFEDVAVNESNATEALIKVEKEGFAPYQKVISLKKDNPVSVIAEMNKPVLTEVIDLSALSPSERATSFMRFGTRVDGNGQIESFAKLLSLSEFKALSNVTLSQDGTQSESIIPVAAFPKGVTQVQVDMQSFDSSKADDFAAFPGKLKGHGKPGLSSAAADGSKEVNLESAGFDLLKLTDQNGDLVSLQPVATSKLSAMADSQVCGGMRWTRYLRQSEWKIIEAWGDDDHNASNGYQVPIWSNDNATGSWQFVALADVNTTANPKYFVACVDTKWEGYLNCDSPLATSRPKQLCVESHDQFNSPLGGVSIRGQKGGLYAYGYTSSYGDTKGHATIEIKDANISGWNFNYSHALTGWSRIDIDPNDISVDYNRSNECDWDLNITIENPYTTRLTVHPYDINGSAAAENARVRVYNYSYGNYFNKYGYVKNGVATFYVKPNVTYKVEYKAVTVRATADGSVTPPETLDTTREVAVDVNNTNLPPKVYLSLNSYNINDASEHMSFSVSASDGNYDPLTFQGLTLDGQALQKDVDYTEDDSYSYDGYYYMRGKLNLQSATLKGLATQLAAKNSPYKLRAIVTDGAASDAAERSFYVRENMAPSIGTMYLMQGRNYYYPTSSHIPDGNMSARVYIYDRDGDRFDVTLALDGAAKGSENNRTNGTVALSLGIISKGSHTVEINATDKNGNSSSKSYTFYAGNHKPTIRSYGATRYFVQQNGTFRLYAYVWDADYDKNITVTARTQDGTTFAMRRNGYYGPYQSDDINISNDVALDGNHSVAFTLWANDGEDNSSKVRVVVRENQNPAVSMTVTPADLNTSTPNVIDLFTGRVVFDCNATDPEKTAVSYAWKLDGGWAGSGSRLVRNFQREARHNVTCIASDRDGGSSSVTKVLSVMVNHPPVFDRMLPRSLNLETGDSHTFVCEAHDPDGRGPVTYKWLINGTDQGVDENVTTYTHVFDARGFYTVSCVATDVDGASSTSASSVTVTVKNTPPSVTPPSTVNVDGNKSVTGRVTFSDPDGTATIAVEGTPPAGFTLNANTGAFSFDASAYATLPTGQTRTLSIPLVVTDNLGARVRVTLTIVVHGVYEMANNTDVKSKFDNLTTVTKAATVADAKNLVNQLREAQTSFIDLNGTDQSTVVARQATVLKTNIEPRVDAIAGDINASVARLQNCAISFETSAEEDFNTTLNAFMARVDAIGKLFDQHEDNETWEANTSAPFNDNVRHTYSKNGTTVTETVTVNGDTLTTSWEDTQAGEVNYVTTNGTIDFSASIPGTSSSYQVNVTRLNFQNNRAELNATAQLSGEHSASATLDELYVTFDINQSIDNPTAVQNADVRLRGTVSAGGRTLSGTLTLNDADASSNKLMGDLTCTANEPSFSGKIVFNLPLQALKEIARDSDMRGNIEPWPGLLMVTFDDNTTSMAVVGINKRIEDQYNSNEETGESNQTTIDDITLITQADRNLSCSIEDRWINLKNRGSHTHNVVCNGGTVTPYYGYDKVFTIETEDGRSYAIEKAWTDYQWIDNNTTAHKIHMSFADGGEAYVDSNNRLVYEGQELRVRSVSVRDAKEFKDYNFDVSVEGTLTDGAKEISARIGLANVLVKGRSDIYIENLGVQIDGDNYLYADKLSFGMRPKDMAGFIQVGLIEGNPWWMYNSIEDYVSRSFFETYSESYNYNSSKEWKEPSLDQFITAIDAERLSLAVLDTNGSTLSFEGNLSARKTYEDTNASVEFSGTYNYDGTSFSGVIDANGTRDAVKDEIMTLNAYVEGHIAANGFEPFGIMASEVFAFGQTEGYLYLTRGTDPLYELGISVIGNVDSTVNVTLADSNGVRGSYSVDANSTAPSVFTLKNVNNQTLATFGKSGNNWEVNYRDGTSETLY